VNNPFDGTGYKGWKRSVLIAMSAKNKLRFITGTQSIPADGSTDLQAWNRCNEMVTSCILNSLSKEIADIVIYSKTVRELWISLEHIFGQSNGAKLYHLQKELSRLIQGVSNIAGYFIKLKRLWMNWILLILMSSATVYAYVKGNKSYRNLWKMRDSCNSLWD